MQMHCGAAAGSCKLGANTWKDRAMEICGLGQGAARAAAGPLAQGAPTYLLTCTTVAGLHGEIPAQTLQKMLSDCSDACCLPAELTQKLREHDTVSSAQRWQSITTGHEVLRMLCRCWRGTVNQTCLQRSAQSWRGSEPRLSQRSVTQTDIAALLTSRGQAFSVRHAASLLCSSS